MEFLPESKNYLSIDSRQNQVSRHQNPIVKYRQPTDRLCLFVFPIIIVVWLIISTLGYVAPQVLESSSVESNLLFYQACFNAPVTRFSIGFILSVVLSTAVVCYYAFLIEKFHKFIINIGVGLYMLGTIGHIYQAIFGTIKILIADEKDLLIPVTTPIICLIFFWLAIIYMIPACLSYFKADKGILGDLTKDSCRAILRNPSIILFISLITLLMTLMASFTYNGVIFDILAARNKFLNYFYGIIILFGGFCALSFLLCLAIVVTTEYAITYFWKNDENASSLVGPSIVNALRNHVGTIMFASTAIVSTICAIVQAFKHKQSGNNKENPIFHFISKVYLALRMPEIGLIFTAIYGTGYIKSSQTAFDLVLRRPSLFLATLAACEAIIYIPVIVTTIGSVIVLFIEVGMSNLFEGTIELYLAVWAVLYPVMCFSFLLCFTMKALLINKIIMLNKEDQDT